MEEEIKFLVYKASFKFITEPSVDGVESNMLIALKYFLCAVQTISKFIEAKQSTNNAKDPTYNEGPHPTKP